MNRISLVTCQLSLSTADVEADIFSGQEISTPSQPVAPALEPGVYRVVDGELFRLVPGLPPEESFSTPTSTLRS